MIVCDADNLSGHAPRPTPETIEEQFRQQLAALKDVRQRLRVADFPKPTTVLPSHA